MIRRLKIKFVILTMASLFVLLSIIIVGMNLINYTSVVNEADEILELISHNKGNFPNFTGGGNKDRDNLGKLPPHMSPEVAYESRYFSVLLDDSGNVIHVDTSRIISVDTTEAIQSQLFADQYHHGIGGICNCIFCSFILRRKDHQADLGKL